MISELGILLRNKVGEIRSTPDLLFLRRQMTCCLTKLRPNKKPVVLLLLLLLMCHDDDETTISLHFFACQRFKLGKHNLPCASIDLVIRLRKPEGEETYGVWDYSHHYNLAHCILMLLLCAQVKLGGKMRLIAKSAVNGEEQKLKVARSVDSARVKYYYLSTQ